jgi:hypothetical protein
VALDTTPTLGKGAVKDTYNLLADGIEKLACRLAEVAGEAIASWADKQDLHRYFGSSLKGEAAIDWDDKAQRAVVDADRTGWPTTAELGRAGSTGPSRALVKKFVFEVRSKSTSGAARHTLERCCEIQTG